MALSPEKIKGLRALAARGEGGEKDNAIAILTRHGIPLTEPEVNKQGTGTRRHPGAERTDAFNQRYQKGTSSQNFNSQSFEDMLKAAMEDGPAGSWMDNPPWERGAPPPPERHWINDIATKMQAHIVNIVAHKVYPGLKPKTNWDQDKQRAFIEGLNDYETGIVRAYYKKNLEPLCELALSAIRKADLLKP